MSNDPLEEVLPGEVEEILPDTPAEPWWKQRARNLVWPLHLRFPNVIPHPRGFGIGSYRQRDAKDNMASSLDEGVNLRLGCIMVSEVFGPNEIDALYDGLTNLNWDRERTPVRESSNIEWLKTQRLYGTEGNMPIGWVNRPEDAKNHFGVRYTAQFPQEFSALLVRIMQLTPSVTCLSVGFVLNELEASQYAEAINKSAQTTFVKTKGRVGYSIAGATHAKEERIRLLRQRYRNLGIAWLSKNFPGFFSENCERSHFPTVEFLHLDGFTPFDEHASRTDAWHHWSRFVNIDNHFGAWICSSMPSLRLSFDAGRLDKTPNHMTTALRWDTVNADDKSLYGIDSLTSRTYFVDERLYGIVAQHALASYIRELLRRLKETRQSLSAETRARGSVAEVEQISTFFRRSIGLPSIAREALALSENDASYRWNISEFTQQFDLNDKKYEIKEALKSFLGRLARQLLEEDQDTREYLNQLSSATGTRESIAAQRRMEFVTAVALVVAVISMVFAGLALRGDSSSNAPQLTPVIRPHACHLGDVTECISIPLSDYERL